MRAVVTVVGKDKTGIIATVSGLLAEMNINILDISQTILAEYFTMIMLVDLSAATEQLSDISDEFRRLGENIGMSIHIQHEDIFNAMHTI